MQFHSVSNPFTDFNFMHLNITAHSRDPFRLGTAQNHTEYEYSVAFLLEEQKVISKDEGTFGGSK